jgi:hypothetical protein
VTVGFLVRCRGCLLIVEIELFAATARRIRVLKRVDGMQCRQQRSSQREQSRACLGEGALTIDHLGV